jgi:chemotaxis protein MotB
MRRRRNRREAAAPQEPAHDRWLLSYADFVTLLLAVFIVLYAFSRGHKKPIQTVSAGIHSGFEDLSLKPPPKIPSTESGPLTVPPKQADTAGAVPLDTAELKSQLEGVLGDAIDKHEIVVQQTSEGLIVSLRDFGFFNSGDAKLLPGAAVELKRTAEVLMKHGLELRVEGHSDDQPIHTAEFESNWQLSTARATSVLTILLNDAKFPPTKISIAGYGPYRPIADNSTPEGRKSNRRVDLVIIEPKKRVDTAHP